MPARKTQEVVKKQTAKYVFYSPKKTGEDLIFTEKFKTKTLEEQDIKLAPNFKEEIGVPHPFDYSIVEGVAKKFGLVNAVLDKISDFTIGPGLFIETDDAQVEKILENWMQETRFRSYLRPWFIQALLKGFSPLEIAGLGDSSVANKIKVVDAGTVYVRIDEYGEIIGYTQYLGSSLSSIRKEKITKLSKEEIIKLDINKIGNSVYGYGLVFPGLSIINDFLGAQKALHRIMARKANNPIHVKMGSMEHDDYPEQADIDAFGSKLQYMNEVTEWVTGPNVEMKVIDFGNIGEKFEAVLKNDLKLLSYAFQVPEVILGASSSGGLNAAGHSQVQMDAFERNIKSYQDQLSDIIKHEIFDKILLSAGRTRAKYKIVWGQQSEEDKRELLKIYSGLLSSKSAISYGLRKEIEKKIATIEGIDYDKVEKENKRAERRARYEDKKRLKQLQLIKKNAETPAAQNPSVLQAIKDLDKKGLAPQEIEAEIEKMFPDIDKDKLQEVFDDYFENE